MPFWTPEEEKIIREHPQMTARELLSFFPSRTFDSVEKKLRTLKLNSFNGSFKNSTLNKEKYVMPQKIDLEKLGKVLIKQLQQTEIKLEIPQPKKIFKGKIKETAVLMLSDTHFGRENHFVDMKTGKDYLTYNTEIAVKEGNRLLGSIHDINQFLSPSYDINTLELFVLGDLVEGEYLFAEQQLQVEGGMGNQLLLAVDILSKLIRELLKEFKQINITNIAGNHGRFKKEAYNSPLYYNNFDFLAGKMIQQIFRDEKRVNIKTPEAFGFPVKIYNWTYWLTHGGGIRSWSGLPWYGLVRYGKEIKSEMPETNIICLGHFHQSVELPIASDMEMLVNGCWIEKDNYTWSNWHRLVKPTQKYFGISPKRPKSWEFDLDLTPKGS